MDQPGPADIAAVVAALQERLESLTPAEETRRDFLATYQRTTSAVARAVDRGAFEDPAWVEVWDVVFADLYLKAFDAERAGGEGVPRPWRLAFDAPADLPALAHVLLGVNAHINYDLPQSLLAVISVEQFADESLLDRRRRDHERIDGVLADRVAAEDAELATRSARTLLDRALRPLNQRASKRFLRESRRKVWHNTVELHQARLISPDAYAIRLAELELLSAAKIADLLTPGQVLLRLAVAGFGVLLPPPK
jgi:hypothetical protein